MVVIDIIKASSIPWHADFYAAPQNSQFAAEFAACHGKRWNCPFFATFIYRIQGFLGSFFNFTIYKTIKSSCCKLTFMKIMIFLLQVTINSFYFEVLSVNTTTPTGHGM